MGADRLLCNTMLHVLYIGLDVVWHTYKCAKCIILHAYSLYAMQDSSEGIMCVHSVMHMCTY